LDIFGDSSVPSSTPVVSANITANSLLDDLSGMSMGMDTTPVTNTNTNANATNNALGDIFGSNPNPSNTAPVVDMFGDSTPISPNPVPVSGGGIMDLYSGSSNPIPPTAPAVAIAPINNLGDLSSISMTPQAPITPQTQDVTVNAVDKNGMRVIIHCSKPDPTNPAFTKMDCKFSNSTQMSFSNLVFQVRFVFIQCVYVNCIV